MALKSHRSHFWQMAMSCNCYSHDVWLTHRLVHDIFLVLECSISIKLGGKKVILLHCKWGEKIHRGDFSHQTVEEEKLPALLMSHQGRELVQDGTSSGGNLEESLLLCSLYLKKFIYMLFLFVLQ